jgi:hypothetical protein
MSPPAHRTSNLTLWPSLQPSSRTAFRNAVTRVPVIESSPVGDFRFSPATGHILDRLNLTRMGHKQKLPYSFCLKATPSRSVAAQRNVEMRSGTASRFWLVKTKELADLILGS